jgi:hypothetical protein
MIVNDCVQGSPEWFNARLAIPTASKFDKIITPKKRQYSASSVDYMHELLAEWMTGKPNESVDTKWTEWGRVMEPEAAEWYELHKGVTTTKVGLILRDDGQVGGSPDRLVGDDGVLEIKCFSPPHHVACLLGEDPAPITQVQGYLWLTGRQWCDMLGYHPDMPPTLIRVMRDDLFIRDLSKAVDRFLEELQAAKRKLEALGPVGRTESLEALLTASLELVK